MKATRILVLLYLYCFNLVASDDCFRSVCIPSEYDKLIKPTITVENNITIAVIGVNLTNIQLLNINENVHTVTLKLKMSLTWEEPRLMILPNATIENFDLMEDVAYDLPKEFTTNLWLPDAYIENVHKITKFNLIRDYESIVYWQKDDMHGLTYQNEIEIIMLCNMIFESYPMDKQTCYFLLGSSSPLLISGQGFELTKLQFNDSEQLALQDYSYNITKYKKYSEEDDIQRVGFQLKFQHNLVPFLMNYYIPSGILVILSWVGIY